MPADVCICVFENGERFAHGQCLAMHQQTPIGWVTDPQTLTVQRGPWIDSLGAMRADFNPEPKRGTMTEILTTPTEKNDLSFGQSIIVDSVRAWVGASLKVRDQELREFVARSVDDPRWELNEHVDDCGLFALAVLYDVGVDHELVRKKYVSGAAITWLVHIAHDLQAVRYPKRDGLPVPGALMHYFSPRPSYNDHVEFCLSFVQTNGFASHAGGGRKDCGISEGTSDIRFSSAKPLQAWFDPEALLGA